MWDAGVRTAGEWKITPEDSDLVRSLDLGAKATAGKHTVELTMSGQGAPAPRSSSATA
jgi:hypothetical protein